MLAPKTAFLSNKDSTPSSGSGWEAKTTCEQRCTKEERSMVANLIPLNCSYPKSDLVACKVWWEGALRYYVCQGSGLDGPGFGPTCFPLHDNVYQYVALVMMKENGKPSLHWIWPPQELSNNASTVYKVGGDQHPVGEHGISSTLCAVGWGVATWARKPTLVLAA